MDLPSRVRKFIVSNFYVSHPERLGDDDSLLDLGVIDSTGVLEIIDFVERELAVAVADSEIVPQNFGTIAAIAAYAARKRALLDPNAVPRRLVG
jgi:acyl carrier protein